jgi:hypothetical protein
MSTAGAALAICPPARSDLASRGPPGHPDTRTQEQAAYLLILTPGPATAHPARRRAERLRIARELHDIVAHSISIIAIQAGSGRSVCDASPAEARDALAAIEAISRETLSGMRRMMTGLRHAEPGSGPGRAPLGPAPGLADIERLAAMTLDAGVQAEVEWLGRTPPQDAPGHFPSRWAWHREWAFDSEVIEPAGVGGAGIPSRGRRSRGRRRPGECRGWPPPARLW